MFGRVTTTAVAAGFALVAMASGAQAATTTIFVDDFNSEIAPGTIDTNFTGFDNFFVDSGTVDMLHVPTLCDDGGCVDLDGTSNDAGLFSSKGIQFIAGESYEVSFDLAGPRDGNGTTELVDFSIIKGILAAQSLTIGRDDGFQTFTFTFVSPVSELGSLVFSNAGGDNFGAILDNVRVNQISAVPLPAGLVLLLTALGVTGMVARRR